MSSEGDELEISLHLKYRIFVSLNFESCLFTNITCNNVKMQFQNNCASRGVHVCRNIWSPKIGQNLVVRQEVGNEGNPFAMSVRDNIPEKLTDFDTVGHVYQLFVNIFVNYGMFIEARVWESKFRPSPILDGGLEIPNLICSCGFCMHAARKLIVLEN